MESNNHGLPGSWDIDFHASGEGNVNTSFDFSIGIGACTRRKSSPHGEFG